MRFDDSAVFIAAVFAALSLAAPSADRTLLSHAGETIPAPNAGPERDADAVIYDPSFTMPSETAVEPVLDDETLYDQEARLETYVDRGGLGQTPSL